MTPTERRWWRRPSVIALSVATVAIGALVLVVVLRSADSSKPDRPRSPAEVLEAIPSDCSRHVHADLNAFLATVPDGSTVDFPPGGCYSLSQSILLKARANLTIDGHGSTFASSAPNDNTKLVPNWWLLRSRGITLRNFTAVGNFNDPGPPSPRRGSVTSNAGVSIYGGRDITVSNVVIRNVFGDGVTLGNAAYFDSSGPAEFPRNIHLDHLNISKAGRHCVSVSQATGFWLEDSTLNDCYLDGLDAEKDLITDPLSDLHILRNTISNYFAVGVVLPVGGPRDRPVEGIEIRGNRFPTLAIAAACNQAIAVGGYPEQFFSNLVIEDNEILAWKVAIEVKRILGGSIRNNRITHPVPGAKVNACGEQHEADVVVNESSDVVVADNG